MEALPVTLLVGVLKVNNTPRLSGLSLCLCMSFVNAPFSILTCRWNNESILYLYVLTDFPKELPGGLLVFEHYESWISALEKRGQGCSEGAEKVSSAISWPSNKLTVVSGWMVERNWQQMWGLLKKVPGTGWVVETGLFCGLSMYSSEIWK